MRVGLPTEAVGAGSYLSNAPAAGRAKGRIPAGFCRGSGRYGPCVGQRRDAKAIPSQDAVGLPLGLRQRTSPSRPTNPNPRVDLRVPLPNHPALRALPRLRRLPSRDRVLQADRGCPGEDRCLRPSNRNGGHGGEPAGSSSAPPCESTTARASDSPARPPFRTSRSAAPRTCSRYTACRGIRAARRWCAPGSASTRRRARSRPRRSARTSRTTRVRAVR